VSFRKENTHKKVSLKKGNIQKTTKVSNMQGHYACDVRIGSQEEKDMFERQKILGVRLQSLYESL
jgi:hypothetical protein